MELQRTTINQLPTANLLQGYQQDVKQFNKFTAGQPITAQLIKEYFEAMRIKGKRPATMQRHRAAVKQAILQVMGQGASLIEKAQVETFFKDIKTGKPDTAISTDKTLSREELKRLIEVSGYKTALIIRALFSTAGRISELCNIELKDCEIRKDGVIIRIFGKGSKEGQVYMTIDLFNSIREAYQGERYLFEVNGKPLSRKTVNTLLKRAGEKIDRPDVHPHMVRHSWASLSLPTLGLPKVSGYLRHSSPDVTAKYYVHGRASMSEILASNVLVG